MERKLERTDARIAAQDHVPATPPPFALLFDRYPMGADPFLLQEVAGLRARGLAFEPVTLEVPRRQPAPGGFSTDTGDPAESFYLPARADWSSLAGMARIGVAQPHVALRSLAALLATHEFGLRGRSGWFASLADSLLLGEWMRTRGLRHIHAALDYDPAIRAVLAARSWGIPYSLTTRGVNAPQLPVRDVLDTLLGGAEAIVCESDYRRSRMMLMMRPEHWPKLHVVPLGVDPAALTPVLAAKPSQSRTLDIVCMARLSLSNGQRLLLEALAALQKRGIAFSATFLGDGPERRTLTRTAAERGLAENVQFATSLSPEESLARLREADLFVLPTLDDSMPMGLMQAMALGLACVSTSVAGIPELIQTGRDGILVAPSNAEALADAMTTLAKDHTLRQFFGRSARRRIVRDYNLPLNQEKLVQCLLASSR